jgi:hypothetical protein
MSKGLLERAVEAAEMFASDFHLIVGHLIKQYTLTGETFIELPTINISLEGTGRQPEDSPVHLDLGPLTVYHKELKEEEE